MGYWEFLLQKEGDQSWLPLDTSQVEILEGRYRVMAHTSQVNTPVRIQISQVLRDGQGSALTGHRTPPKRRTLRRQGEINENGLMVVMPFTRLGEGTWDILCASEAGVEAGVEAGIMEGSASEASARVESNAAAGANPPWSYAVELRVVGQDSADDGDWFDDGGGDGNEARAADRSAAAGIALNRQAAVNLQTAAAAMDEFQAQMAAGLIASDAPYGLALPHTALLGSEGESLGLTATVTGDLVDAPSLALVVRLSDPQTTAAVALAAVPLIVATLPATVNLSVTAPAQLSTRLLLGEVGLLAGAEVVALQRFTVTVDVASLFDAIANHAETEAALGVVFPADDGGGGGDTALPTADLKTWDIVGRGAPPREMPMLTLPRSSPELPPKIYYPSPHEAATHQPSLPPVGRPKPAAPASPPSSGDLSSGSPSARPPNPEPARGLSLPPVSSPPKADDSIAVLTGRAPTAPGRQPRGPEPQLISHEAMGFRDLNLQDRFWNRLNELAVSLQQEALENRAEAEAGPSPTTAPGEQQAEAEAEAEPVFIPFAGEVVIYEDEDPTLRYVTASPMAVPPPEAETPPEVVTPPMPSLELPEGDLTAGEPVVATLRVPFHPNRLYVKVWITDPQTRTLADEPRQLLNLLPNGQGQLEGSLQLTVPLGCLDAWFEAIAIDMVTQQESYKTSVSRAITPAGLPPSALDDEF